MADGQEFDRSNKDKIINDMTIKKQVGSTLEMDTDKKAVDQEKEPITQPVEEAKLSEKEEEIPEEVPEIKEPTLEEKLAELNDAHLRLRADFENYRKRTIREKGDLIKSANRDLLIGLLPVVDNFERALESMQEGGDIKSVNEGVSMIYNQLTSLLKQQGVVVMDTESKPFDTEYHEAITTIPAPNKTLKDKIVDCTTKGYMFNDKVLRHAKVVVGK